MQLPFQLKASDNGRLATKKRKSVNVKLKATDRHQLLRTFGRRVTPDGVLLPIGSPLEVGTPVLVKLSYSGGEVALSGAGEVTSYSTEQKTANLRIDWDKESQELMAWMLSEKELSQSSRPAPLAPDSSPAPSTALIPDPEAETEVNQVPKSIAEMPQDAPPDWDFPHDTDDISVEPNDGQDAALAREQTADQASLAPPSPNALASEAVTEAPTPPEEPPAQETSSDKISIPPDRDVPPENSGVMTFETEDRGLDYPPHRAKSPVGIIALIIVLGLVLGGAFYVAKTQSQAEDPEVTALDAGDEPKQEGTETIVEKPPPEEPTPKKEDNQSNKPQPVKEQAAIQKEEKPRPAKKRRARKRRSKTSKKQSTKKEEIQPSPEAARILKEKTATQEEEKKQLPPPQTADVPSPAEAAEDTPKNTEANENASEKSEAQPSEEPPQAAEDKADSAPEPPAEEKPEKDTGTSSTTLKAF